MKRSLVLLLLLLAPDPAAAVDHEVDVLIEATMSPQDAATGWTARGLGKLPDATMRFRVALDYTGWLTETLGLHFALDARSDDETTAGLSEAWIAWRPVPTSAWRHRLRAGAFIPPFSMEHTRTGWSSPWMPTASVLNSWVGEELHVTGIEYALNRPGAMVQSPESWHLRAGLYTGNDTSGTMLSWRGWAQNDRVTLRGRTIPVPVRAAFLPGGTFPGPKNSDPFVDLDDRIGYYVTAEWQHGTRWRVTGAHYDNRADPLAFAAGQAGWHTRFQVAGIHFTPTTGLDLLAQYAAGNTFVGRRGTQFSVDNDFSAWFVLARRNLGRHELAARVEGFRVTDEDPNTLDDNREDGRAWALSWQFRPDETGHWTIGVEYLQILSDRPERALLALPVVETERQLRALVRAQF